ncbi:hypothetical protein C8R44DRAFT_723570 [Mycena epipterygia]|nr:hypothetical protein C8R44DRAFT_723570 [Mycena epipterygia]
MSRREDDGHLITEEVCRSWIRRRIASRGIAHRESGCTSWQAEAYPRITKFLGCVVFVAGWQLLFKALSVDHDPAAAKVRWVKIFRRVMAMVILKIFDARRAVLNFSLTASSGQVVKAYLVCILSRAEAGILITNHESGCICRVRSANRGITITNQESQFLGCVQP